MENFNFIEKEILKNEHNFLGNNMLIDEFEEEDLEDCYIDRGKYYKI